MDGSPMSTQGSQMEAGPKVITTRDKIRGVADAWRKQYEHDGQWTQMFDGDSFDYWERLSALDRETATAADVAAIVGNSTWTALSCNQCNRRVETVVQLGDEPDYDSAMVYVCEDCLDAALSAVRATGEKP